MSLLLFGKKALTMMCEPNDLDGGGEGNLYVYPPPPSSSAIDDGMWGAALDAPGARRGRRRPCCGRARSAWRRSAR